MDKVARGMADRAIQYGNVMPQVLKEQATLSKGGAIGIGDKAAFAITFDDSTYFMKTNMLAEMRSRFFPWTMGLITNPSNDNNKTVTVAEFKTWAHRWGMEPWAHGYNHDTPWNRGDLTREIVLSKNTVESYWGLKCQGFIQVGATPSGEYKDLDKNKLISNFYSEAGRMIYENHAHYSAYIGPIVRRLPTGNYLGAARYTVTAMPPGKTSAQHRDDTLAQIALCIKYKLAMAFLIHPQQIDYTNVGSSNQMYYSDVVLILDALKAARDAETAEMLTLSGLLYADHSTVRVDLAKDNLITFAGVSPEAPGFWSLTNSSYWGDKIFHASSPTWGVPSFEQTNLYDVAGEKSLVGQINNLFAFAGESFELRCRVRSTTAQQQRIKLQLTGTSGLFLDIQAGATNTNLWGEFYAQPGQGSFLRVPFTLPIDTTFLKAALGRGNGAAGSGNGLEWGELSIVKI
ncbi:hypothetical protein SAMN04487969_11987 [Paenibacillus algorifonticola]|uniref:Polysaccharide deacetylase n=1 Tax=Paenibacillus algorifonticola TaxID=684063 RepID=A0A1I2H1P3_9BACL|nr:hypothetical protein [Paenibacillus algorifonticola]SFF23313.1 hypothetical protein SAMN04487969_11987 [Paenibacillus algorifonticola]